MLQQNSPIEMMIIDDHPMVIEGLRSLLADQEGIHIAQAHTLGEAAFRILGEQRIDVVLLDINLPDVNGTDLCARITSAFPQVRVLGISTYSEASLIHRMIQNGAKGYLLKNASADELVRAVQLVHGGQVYFSPEVQKILAEFSIQEKPKLTRREQEVLQLIAAGVTTQQIADQLFLSPLTIETHRRNIMQKFGVNNAPAMIRAAVDHKYL
ncbi:response regulator [Parapedobacter sp. 2B3]|uniref:response regulator n=1 Tax=Parapedobacter sp. 2B3 TaxID=3342381 RepID=UPI0035B5BDAD